MNHTLAYRALVERAIDLTEMYTTDGEIAQYDLLVLKDDGGFFPAYEAVWLYRADLAERHPAVVEQLRRLEGRISEAQMQRMNAAVQEGKREEGAVAAEFLRSELGVDTQTSDGTLAQRVLATTGEHLLLVIPSLLAAVLVGVPLGVIAARQPALGRVVFAATGILQTIPSLALLLFMIPVDDVARGERNRGPAGDRRVVPVQPAADRAKHARRPDGDSRVPARVRRGARAAAAGGPLAGRTAVGDADDPGRRADGGGDQRRHGDPRRVHRGRRLRPPDPPRNRQIRRAPHARRGGSGGAAGLSDRGFVRAWSSDPSRTTVDSKRPELIREAQHLRGRNFQGVSDSLMRGAMISLRASCRFVLALTAALQLTIRRVLTKQQSDRVARATNGAIVR